MKTIQLKDSEEFNAVIAGLRALEFLREQWLHRVETHPALSEVPPVLFIISGPRIAEILELAEDSGDVLNLEGINALVQRINSGTELCKDCGDELVGHSFGTGLCPDCNKIRETLAWDAERRAKEDDERWSLHQELKHVPDRDEDLEEDWTWT